MGFGFVLGFFSLKQSNEEPNNTEGAWGLFSTDRPTGSSASQDGRGHFRVCLLAEDPQLLLPAELCTSVIYLRPVS